MNKISKENLIKKVRQYVQRNSLSDDIHGFEHVKRVYKLSVKIGKKSNANLYILKIAALLHDIGRVQEKKSQPSINHAELSAQKASEFLNSFREILNEKDIESILHAIRAHSFSNKIPPTTLEAKILSDTDKLDALGAIGLYRTIGFTVKHEGNIKDVINHLEEKLLDLKNKMYLKLTRRIAQERYQILADFYQKIKKEI
jgi:uncharacterized protein